MANAQETQGRQTRYEVLMNQGAKWAKYISQSAPPLAPGYQAQLLALAVIAQELRAMTEAIRNLTDTVRNMQ